MTLRFSIPFDTQARLNMLQQLHDTGVYRRQGRPVTKPKPISPSSSDGRSMSSDQGQATAAPA